MARGRPSRVAGAIEGGHQCGCDQHRVIAEQLERSAAILRIAGLRADSLEERRPGTRSKGLENRAGGGAPIGVPAGQLNEARGAVDSAEPGEVRSDDFGHIGSRLVEAG